jgi:hypothetical protein
MNQFLIIAGTWLLSDAVYSWVLYAHTQSWRGDKQNFAKDHWVRLVRAILAIGIIVVGCVSGV